MQQRRKLLPYETRDKKESNNVSKEIRKNVRIGVYNYNHKVMQRTVEQNRALKLTRIQLSGCSRKFNILKDHDRQILTTKENIHGEVRFFVMIYNPPKHLKCRYLMIKKQKFYGRPRRD